MKLLFALFTNSDLAKNFIPMFWGWLTLHGIFEFKLLIEISFRGWTIYPYYINIVGLTQKFKASTIAMVIYVQISVLSTIIEPLQAILLAVL